MAKVIMPLMSAEASGKLASSIVYFTWKGINVVRQYTIPTNPRDIDQRIVRQKLACCGKNTKFIATPTTGLLNGSDLYQLIKAETPAGAIWNAELVKQIMQDMAVEANFTALSAALAGVGATNHTIWETTAAGLGFEDLTGDAYATTIPAELAMFMGAYGAHVMELCGADYDFSDYPSNWTDAKVRNFGTSYAAAA